MDIRETPQVSPESPPNAPDPRIRESQEALEAARVRGGKNRVGKKGPHRQKHGSLETPNGGSWLRIRADYETGAFTANDLAQLYGVNPKTVRYRIAKDGWVRSVGPTVSRALPGLVAEVADGLLDSETIESAVAAAEGRPIDADAVLLEKGQAIARRKAGVIRDHREMALRLRSLFNKSVDHLEDYCGGKLRRSYVRGVNSKGEEMILSFSLFSRQTGLIEAVDKTGAILERVIRIERQVHGLETVDGDGRDRGDRGSDPSSLFRGRTTEELETDLSTLIESLRSPARLTPVPSAMVPHA